MLPIWYCTICFHSLYSLHQGRAHTDNAEGINLGLPLLHIFLVITLSGYSIRHQENLLSLWSSHNASNQPSAWQVVSQLQVPDNFSASESTTSHLVKTSTNLVLAHYSLQIVLNKVGFPSNTHMHISNCPAETGVVPDTHLTLKCKNLEWKEWISYYFAWSELWELWIFHTMSKLL